MTPPPRLSRAAGALSAAQASYAAAAVAAGAVGEEALASWLEGEAAAGRAVYDLSEQLPAAGLVGEFELTQRLARHLGLPAAGDVELEMFSSAHPALDRALCAEYGLVCLSDEPKSPLPVAVSNPLDAEVLAYVSSLVGAPLKVHVARLSDIARELDACYGTAEEWARFLAEREQERAPERAPEQGREPAPPAPPAPPLDDEAERLLPTWRTPEEDGYSIEEFKRLLGALGRGGS